MVVVAKEVALIPAEAFEVISTRKIQMDLFVWMILRNKVSQPMIKAKMTM